MPSQTNWAAPAITVQKCAAFAAPMLILSSAGLSVSWEKWHQEQRHQPFTVSLQCLDLRNENLGVNVSCQGLC